MESHLAQDCLSLEYVPRSFNRDLMIALLSQFGEIADIQMHYNHSTEIEFNGFGSGFVRFSSYDQAARAMRELNGFRVHGHPLRLSWPRNNSSMNYFEKHAYSQNSTIQVLVSFISRDLNVIVTKNFLSDVFSRFGEVLYVVMKKSQFDPNNSVQTGYGFVHFADTPEGIFSAFEALNVVKNVVIDGVAFDCRMSNSMRARFGRGGAPKKTVHPQHRIQRFVGGGDYLPQNRVYETGHNFGYQHTLPSQSIFLDSKISEKPRDFCSYKDSPAPLEFREVRAPPGLCIEAPTSDFKQPGYATDMNRLEEDLHQKDVQVFDRERTGSSFIDHIFSFQNLENQNI